MTMFPSAATSTQHHLHHQNLSCYTDNRCHVDANTTSSYGGYLNQSIFGTRNFLNNYVQGEGYHNFCCAVNSSDHHQTASLVGSAYSQVMAEEDESKTETEISKAVVVHDHEEEAAGSSSKDLIKNPVDDEEGGGWLQLSIGSHTVTTGSSDYNQYHHDNENKVLHDGRLIMQTRGDEEDIYRQQFVELDLLPNSSCGGGGVNTDEVKSNTNFTQESVIMMNRSPAAAASSTDQQQQQQYYYSPVLPPRPTNLLLQHYNPPPPTATCSHYPLNPYNYHNQQQVGNYQDYNPHWPTFRSSSASAASSSSSLMPPVPSYFSRLPFQLHGASAAAGVDVAHHLPRFDFRVVDPPRRPHSGIWFTLQASQIQ